MVLSKNKKITELPYIGKEYSISFELFINKFGNDLYQSVIHLTTGENYADMGSRNPVVWVRKSKQLSVSSSISGMKSLNKRIPGLKEKKWQKIEITQKPVDGKVVNKYL